MEIIKKPVLSEKMTKLTDKQNRVAFIVDKSANKLQIKEAIEKMYDVKVREVNTMIYQGDAKTRNTKRGVLSGRTASFKKAIVTLAEGNSIDFFSNI
jgi:large subunit ribosomal protein L23